MLLLLCCVQENHSVTLFIPNFFFFLTFFVVVVLIRRILLILFYFYHIYIYIFGTTYTIPNEKTWKKLHHSVSLAVFRYNVKEPYRESERESRKKLSNKQQFDYKRRGIEEVVVDEEKWGGVEENWKEISAIPFFFCLLFCYFCLLLENHSSLILNQHQQQQ